MKKLNQLSQKTLDAPLKIKAINDKGEFSGYGSIFGNKDSYDDIVMPGAFENSLKRWSEKESLPALLWQHDTKEPIGIYTSIKEDAEGLFVEGKLLIDDDPLAKRAYAHMKAGSLTGLSIGYQLKDYEWDKDKEAFLLKEIDLWEVSVVTFPANESAQVSDVKTALDNNEIPSASLVERLLRDAGFSRKQAKGFMSRGYASLRDAEEIKADDVLSTFTKIFEV